MPNPFSVAETCLAGNRIMPGGEAETFADAQIALQDPLGAPDMISGDAVHLSVRLQDGVKR